MDIHILSQPIKKLELGAVGHKHVLWIKEKKVLPADELGSFRDALGIAEADHRRCLLKSVSPCLALLLSNSFAFSQIFSLLDVEESLA